MLYALLGLVQTTRFTRGCDLKSKKMEQRCFYCDGDTYINNAKNQLKMWKKVHVQIKLLLL